MLRSNTPDWLVCPSDLLEKKQLVIVLEAKTEPDNIDGVLSSGKSRRGKWADRM